MNVTLQGQYVVGFLFSRDRKQVALLKKDRPACFAGLLSGVGGGIEFGETPEEAMAREFWEEAVEAESVEAVGVEWRRFARVDRENCVLHAFVAFGEIELTSKTSEPVAWFDVADLPSLAVIPNVRWMIPMALDEENVAALITVPAAA